MIRNIPMKKTSRYESRVKINAMIIFLLATLLGVGMIYYISGLKKSINNQEDNINKNEKLLSLINNLIERTVNYPINDRIIIAKFLPNDDDGTRDMIFKFAFSGLVFTMINWYRNGFNVSTRDMAKSACRMFREPLFPTLADSEIWI